MGKREASATFQGYCGQFIVEKHIFQAKSQNIKISVHATFNDGFLIIFLFGNVNLILP